MFAVLIYNYNYLRYFSKTEVTQITTVPRGRPKSGRIWKTEKSRCVFKCGFRYILLTKSKQEYFVFRFSSIVKTKGIRDKFERKQALRTELKRVKDASRAIIAAKKEQKELQKQRRRDNLKRQEENRKKSEVVQVIKNPSKIKRMKKKQLRYIEKRDTTNM